MLKCESCVVKELDRFNKQHPDFPNGDLKVELEFRVLVEKIKTCVDRINGWSNNGSDYEVDRDKIASVTIRLLTTKPAIPISFQVSQNLEQLRTNSKLLRSVAQFFKIEPKELKELL